MSLIIIISARFCIQLLWSIELMKYLVRKSRRKKNGCLYTLINTPEDVIFRAGSEVAQVAAIAMVFWVVWDLSLPGLLLVLYDLCIFILTNFFSLLVQNSMIQRKNIKYVSELTGLSEKEVRNRKLVLKLLNQDEAEQNFPEQNELVCQNSMGKFE